MKDLNIGKLLTCGGDRDEKNDKFIFALMMLAIFSAGCGVAGDVKVKCPKCGAIFTVDEGLAEIQKKGF